MNGIAWMVRHMANVQPVKHKRARTEYVSAAKDMQIERLLKTGEYRTCEIADICSVDDDQVRKRKQKMQKAGVL
ncbi:hypothetical protein CAL26_09790 [Bordetella genomosp. 9]|uniref:Transposase n=1 Tax=Bordetella genomosp. 9 TaxID=1416803 RepID=A0A261RHC1_9BORD|nr:hypothetical protein [Bordetella genomosp. 9]OZI23713.1 hypothetical protein CAL26_09790 [Bordetella genomosp. 9]